MQTNYWRMTDEMVEGAAAIMQSSRPYEVAAGYRRRQVDELLMEFLVRDEDGKVDLDLSARAFARYCQRLDERDEGGLEFEE